MPSRKTKPAKKVVPPAPPKPKGKSAKVAGTAKAGMKPRPAKAGEVKRKPAAGKKVKKPPGKVLPVPIKIGKVKKPKAKETATSPPSEPLSIHDRKVAVRREIRSSLDKMRERARRSGEICEAILTHPSWRRSTIVAIFAPMPMEPDVELLWPHADGKTICYPAIRMGGLDFIGVTGPESLVVGQFGVREPVFDQARIIPPDTFDLVFVPGAAFTANGDRLGRGGGFYDRLLSSPGFRAFKVGVCFERQVIPEIPMETHDQRVHRVVTESGWLQRPDFVKKPK